MHIKTDYNTNTYKTFECKSSDVEIRSSLNGHWEVIDVLRKYLSRTRKSLRIVCPWLGKEFIDIMRQCVPSDISIELFTAKPKENDPNFSARAIEALKDEAKVKHWNLNIRCNQRIFLHQKIVIIDGELAICGSLNPTLNGIYYNLEILIILRGQHTLQIFNKQYEELWNSKGSIDWELMRFCNGYEYSPQFRFLKRIAEEIFVRSQNQIDEQYLSEDISKHLYVNRNTVEDVIANLKRDGCLDVKKPNFVQWTKNNNISLGNDAKRLHDFM